MFEGTDGGATPRLLVEVSADGLSATLELQASGADGEEATPNFEDALAALISAGVRYGLQAPRLSLALRSPGQRIVVAEGRPAVAGENGSVAYAASLLSVGGRPHVDQSGRVSLFDLDLIHNVAAGEVLATRIPPTPGEPGISVHGEPIAPRPGRPAHLRPGAGTCLSVDGEHIVAAVAGHAVLTGDTVIVSAIYDVHGDVGPRTGHIDFVGSVRISGNVDRGYRVKAGGDVEVQGSVAGGEVEARGSVSVRHGIQGRDGHGSVSASGTVRAKFVEFASVHAGGNVYASDGIVHSTVQAGSAIEVLGSHGSIIGGRVVARDSVKAHELGSAHDIVTEVVVGVAPTLIAEAQQIRKRAVEVAQELGAVQPRIAQLQVAHRQGHLNALGRNELVECHARYRALLEERVAITSRQQELAELLLALPRATIIAEEICHTGVHVTIGTATYATHKEWRGVRFARNQQTGAIEQAST